MSNTNLYFFRHPARTSHKFPRKLLFILSASLLLLYLCVFAYLNLYRYTQQVDSDIAVDALLSREIWLEKDLTPDNWIASTERLVVGVPALAAPLYGLTGSLVTAMGVGCILTGLLLLLSIYYTFRKCGLSRLSVITALLALCALPINGIRNDGQMVPFVILLWFLFADYYAMHSICLFLCIAFAITLQSQTAAGTPGSSLRRQKLFRAALWIFLTGLCGGLALGGMRCLQVVILPLTVWECMLLFMESSQFSQRLPRERWKSTAFILSLLLVGIAAKLYPTNVNYPMYIQNAAGMVNRLTKEVPAAVLECLGIAGGCTLTSFAALMQLGILAVLALTIYGLFFLLRRDKASGRNRLSSTKRLLLGALSTSFLLTVGIEVITNAETAHNYFFTIWFVVITVLALLIDFFEEKESLFSHLIVVCVCIFAVANLFYTYKDCITTTDNLQEYQEVIDYMDSQDIQVGYGEFWDASRISVMTDGRITMGHCYHMEDLHMYWWTTSTKWYVPSLPEKMPTAYVVPLDHCNGFEAGLEDPSVVTLGFENERFAVYISNYNLVRML